MAMRREDLHRLVDAFSDEDVPFVGQLLNRLQGRSVLAPDLAAICASAPVADGVLTGDALRAISEADEAIARGESVSSSDILTEFDLGRAG